MKKNDYNNSWVYKQTEIMRKRFKKQFFEYNIIGPIIIFDNNCNYSIA